MLDTIAIYETPYSTCSIPKEKWNVFWFCKFWNLDWNNLLSKNDDNYIVWLFAEYEIEEPVDEFLSVRSSCPIALDENDSSEQLVDKINMFFEKTTS